MKFADLKSVAHNIADSLGSGIGMMIGAYEMDIYGEALKSTEGFITVDFLSGTSTGGRMSADLARDILSYRDALASLCARHGVDRSAFAVLTARYGVDNRYGGHFTVTVEDRQGHRSVDEYVGVPGRRLLKRGR